ncbi:MAG: amino acid ABC transporter permease [bacterium]|nr:amino acid ABC transporter permease [bacterium]
MTDQPQGIVHGVIEELEKAPDPPPSGPWIWVQENLLGGDTRLTKFFNGLLTVVFALIAVNILQFLTSYIFNPERRWSAVTFNMKLMMVQAFPQADLFRIWLSIGIFFVLVALSLVAWGLRGQMSLWTLSRGLRNAGVFLMLMTVMHGAFEASKILPIPLFSIDSPADWSGTRLLIFVIGLAMFAGAFMYLRREGIAAKDKSIPFLSLIAVGMGLVTLVIWTIDLPIPDGQFDETLGPIATSTTGPWTILFAVAIAAYFFGRWLIGIVEPARLRRWLVILWLFSYPVIIMVIQRKPILEWGDILAISKDSPLGLFLLFSVIGGAVIWWLALPDSLPVGRGIAVAIGALLILAGWPLEFFFDEMPALVGPIATLAGVALIAGGLMIHDRVEIARIIGSVLAIVALLVWFVPMPFLVRGLFITFAFVAVAAPSFGGTAQTRNNMVAVWVAIVFLVVATFVLGEAETALEFQSTTFLGGFNLSILLAISGVALSFPLGVVLALARTSSMPIFRLLATAYIEIVRSVPLITWLFFGSVMISLFLPGGISFDEIVRVVAAVSIFNAAYVAENIRGGLQSINKGQYEAGSAMGLSTVQSTALIIMPQAIRAVLPALVGSVIVSFKDTSLVAIIGLADVLLIAKSFVPGQTNPHNFLGTQPQMLFFIAIFYWMFTFTFSRMALRYEKSLGLGER